MEITENRENSKLTLTIVDRIDTVTAPEFEKVINEKLDGVDELVIDLKGVDYVSSAGLRVFLRAQKIMNQQGSMKVVNVQYDVMQIFEITGFTDILNLE